MLVSGTSPWLLPAATQEVARPESKSSAKLRDSPGEQRDERQYRCKVIADHLKTTVGTPLRRTGNQHTLAVVRMAPNPYGECHLWTKQVENTGAISC